MEFWQERAWTVGKFWKVVPSGLEDPDGGKKEHHCSSLENVFRPDVVALYEKFSQPEK